METVYYAARANLRRLMILHPNWTRAQLAQVTGMPRSWVDKRKKVCCRCSPIRYVSPGGSPCPRRLYRRDRSGCGHTNEGSNIAYLPLSPWTGIRAELEPLKGVIFPLLSCASATALALLCSFVIHITSNKMALSSDITGQNFFLLIMLLHFSFDSLLSSL